MSPTVSEFENSMNFGRAQTVIRIDPQCRLIPQLTADAFMNIQGIYEVHVDETCKKIRIIFDGKQETKNRLSAYLCSCEKKPRCGAGRPCRHNGETRKLSIKTEPVPGKRGVCE